MFDLFSRAVMKFLRLYISWQCQKRVHGAWIDVTNTQDKILNK